MVVGTTYLRVILGFLWWLESSCGGGLERRERREKRKEKGEERRKEKQNGEIRESEEEWA